MNAFLHLVETLENDPNVDRDQWKRIARKAAESADGWETMHKNFLALMQEHTKGADIGKYEI